MFKIYIIRRLLNYFDYFQQKKIFNFIKKKLSSKLVLIDVGAHHGETIKYFIKNFDFKEIHSFEASKENFDVLIKNLKNINNSNITVNNFGLSNQKLEHKFHEFIESSSSTLSNINLESLYFKRKIRVLGLSNHKEKPYRISKVKLDLLDNYIEKKNINRINLIKIDTEGHEYFVLKGVLKNMHKINYIYFEHHYDNMLNKGYTFSKIHELLKKNNFKKIFKTKMYFRKTFEYIYENSRFN